VDGAIVPRRVNILRVFGPFGRLRTRSAKVYTQANSRTAFRRFQFLAHS
jgi:hypothetical protein